MLDWYVAFVESVECLLGVENAAFLCGALSVLMFQATLKINHKTLETLRKAE